MTVFPSVTQMVHAFLNEIVQKGDHVLDATVGLGRDTCVLARLVGGDGIVWAFDIQESACRATAQNLEEQGLLMQTKLYCDSHANLAHYPIQDLKAAVFNLGWLPGGNHRITTLPETTRTAIEAAMKQIVSSGCLFVTTYPGHPGGDAELTIVKDTIKNLEPSLWKTMEISFPNQKEAPVLLISERRAQSKKE